MATTRRKVTSKPQEKTKKPLHRDFGYLYRFKQLVTRHDTSYFDSPRFLESELYGYYICFWVVLSLFATGVLLSNYMEKGYFLADNVFKIMRRDLFKIGLLDLVMYLCMYVTYGLQVLVKNHYINWWKYGWVLQHLWQSAYFFFFLITPRYFEFPWIGSVFIVLHAIVQLMKQHSYAVCNGWLYHLTFEIKKLEETEVLQRNSENDSHQKDPLTVAMNVNYPKNVTLSNFFWYTMFPTCVYEVDYPRTDQIRWSYLVGKIIEVFGIILIILVYSEQFMYPYALYALGLRDVPLADRLWHYPIFLFKLFGPFVIIYNLTFYLIWDAILNGIAELTRFGDREFYRDWWNSQTWDKFARDWNVPVHHFLSRHVYHSTIFWLKLSKPAAATFTFMLSACMHEVIMYVIFGRIRGYLLLAQLSQLPLEMLTLVPAVKKRPAVGIGLFWLGMAIGPSVLCSAYLMF